MLLDFEQCGMLKVNGGVSEIVCNPKTGELVLIDAVLGNCVMSEVSVQNPVEASREAYLNIINSRGCDGVVIAEEYIILFKDDKASYYRFDDPENATHVVTYDLDIQYEE